MSFEHLPQLHDESTDAALFEFSHEGTSLGERPTELGGVPFYLGEPFEKVLLPDSGPNLHGDPNEIAGYVPPVIEDGREGVTPEGNSGPYALEQQGPVPSPATFGHPETDAQYWTYQGISGFCGPDSVSMILNEFGIHDSEQAVAVWSLTHHDVSGNGPGGQIDPGPGELGFGMTSQQMAEALTAGGVPAIAGTGNYNTLVDALGSGHGVILSVNANELWHNEGTGGPPEPHAVVLTGIDPSTGMAYINDPGYPDGRMEAVPLSNLLTAWQQGPGGGNQMVETLQAPAIHTAG